MLFLHVEDVQLYSLAMTRFSVFVYFLFPTRNTVPAYGPVHLQPLLHFPYGGQHVCPVDILIRNRLHLRKGAVSRILFIGW